MGGEAGLDWRSGCKAEVMKEAIWGPILGSRVEPIMIPIFGTSFADSKIVGIVFARLRD